MNILKIKTCVKGFFLLGLTSLSLQTIDAQTQRNPVQRQKRQAMRQEAINRLQEAKWSFIIYRLNLSEERSNQLLPIYKAFEAEKKDIMMSGMSQFKGNKDSMDDSQAEAFINARQENAQKLLDLREKYKPKFLTVLSAKELLILVTAEQDFAMKIMMEKQRRKANVTN
ncbi:hypothetical protein F0919_10515 [Taibaiella lutea]|uniref:Periplasmic heavy metal sensor n=1 Tax=Taibaiella lutea TaxID=2608001 RepID=A0A5M6CM17_9BACT|nr:hypothetical protein [Taibaiella lutea]KAA5535022.1 hypothetical protein F0919_10515 [Taibaiella lutea]